MSVHPFHTWGRSDWGAKRPGEPLSEAGIDSYRSNLRYNVRGLWTGEMDMAQFVAIMTDTVERGIMTAWREGAARAGVAEDELTTKETDARMAFMWAQWSQIPKFAAAVEEGSKANKGKLTPQLRRVDLWANQYNSAVVQAYAMAGADLKGLWILGPTEEHCSSCSRLAGKVKRMSYWRDHVLPQNAPNPALSCGGWN
jgi:hypothetical protein